PPPIPPPPPPPQSTELSAWDTVTSVPSNDAWSAFTVIDSVDPKDESVCSFATSEKTPGTSKTTWFGSPETPTVTPPTDRSKISLVPDTPSHPAPLPA